LKKKIALLLPSLSKGGAERVIATVANNLNRDFEVHIILLYDKIEYEIESNINIHILKNGINLKFFRFFGRFYNYYRLLKIHKIDYCLSTLYYTNLMNSCIKVFQPNTKIKVIIREAILTSIHTSTRNSIFAPLLIRNIYPFADYIIALSKLMKYDLSTNFKIKSEKIVQIYNPLNPKILSLVKTKNIVKFNPSNHFVFLHVGRFDAQKNHQLLIEAFSKLEVPRIELWLIGEGETQERIVQLVKKNKIQSKVKFLGLQDNPYPFMLEADCLVSSSNFEGLSNVLLEALACSLPIIATDCPSGSREILAPKSDFMRQLTNKIERAEYGILTPVRNSNLLAEAMMMMIKNSALRSNYQNKSLNRAANFELKKIMKQYYNILN